MSKRYYLSPVVGDGLSPETAFRPKLAGDGSVNYVAEIKTDPATGQPIESYALCLVSGNKHAAIIADQDNKALPEFPLDAKISAMNTATRNRLKLDLAGFGIPASVVDNADGYRDSIRSIGRILNPTFDENNFDVSE